MNLSIFGRSALRVMAPLVISALSATAAAQPCSPEWTALTGGGTNNNVNALTVFSSGGSPVLCAGGTFTTAGGTPASRVAKWNGTAWSALGNGVNSTVNALCVFDDGSGPALIVGGAFSTAGTGPANGVAKWNGTSW